MSSGRSRNESIVRLRIGYHQDSTTWLYLENMQMRDGVSDLR